MRWEEPKYDHTQVIHKLCKELNVSRSIATLLANRGINDFDSAKEFFRPQLEKLHDPFLMQDMQKAVQRILQAIKKGEKMMIYGDYDVDGTTSVALVYSFLKSFTSHLIYYIPNRYEEGYGISTQGIDRAKKENCQLIIALDCGIKAVDKVEYARTMGIDFVICDHHTPGGQLPNAVAVLDPKRKDCSYPYKELCGCGIGFKLIQALGMHLNKNTKDLVPYLDLVAIAIAADIVPITFENRILAYYGIQVINNNPRIGIKTLINLAQRKSLKITDLVFGIAPRINAAGRIKSGMMAVNLLCATTNEEAQNEASKIEECNTSRKLIDENTTSEALHIIKEKEQEFDYTTVVWKENWHKGVIGIVASRLIETHYRPTIVLTGEGDLITGSARSVKGFNIYEAIEACSNHLVRFGGHKYAAGLTLNKNKLNDFKNNFEQYVKSHIDPQLMTPQLQVEPEIKLGEITPKLLRILNQFEPFGPGNMRPNFLSKNLKPKTNPTWVGSPKIHLKMEVIQNKTSFSTITFNAKKYKELLGKEFSAVYTIEENQWMGNNEIQLKIKDIKTQSS